jgi:DNA helicase HerA-like ATPase
MQDQASVTVGYTHKLDIVAIPAGMANRHGLIAGATGTGKTVTLQTLAEGFSRLGVPVFTADVKGDLAGIAAPGMGGQRIEERIRKLGIQGRQSRPCPAILWDLYGKRGHPIRATISEMGPLLLGRLLNLNDIQQSVLGLTFQVADDQGLLLLDLKDLRAMLAWIGDNAATLRTTYGNIAPTTIGTIQRSLLDLEQAGAAAFFAEPALQLSHLMQRDFSGNGVVSILDATRLIQDSRLYATFLLWLLSELFEHLDEVGDMDKPRLVFFFDEAHLLFKDTPKALVEKIEQVVRLIRSKGVGVYLVTQNPLDIPDTVLGQLGHRVQHALRAFTPTDQKAVRAAAETFRQNPAFNTESVIGELEVGEALVSVLDAQGRPSMVDRVWIAPPESRIGPLQDAERAGIVARSPLAGQYDQIVDRESAYERLQQRNAAAQQATAPTGQTGGGWFQRSTPQQSPRPTPTQGSGWGMPSSSGGRRDSLGEAMMKSVVRSVGSSVGRSLVRGLMGSLLGGGRGRRLF